MIDIVLTKFFSFENLQPKIVGFDLLFGLRSVLLTPTGPPAITAFAKRAEHTHSLVSLPPCLTNTAHRNGVKAAVACDRN